MARLHQKLGEVTMDNARDQDTAICIVLPTYNNKLTIGDVVSSIQKVAGNVIVVDDGSTDGASEILSGIPGIEVVTHERNLGKGAALVNGLAFAAQKGYTHAVTMDGDGQHLAVDFPKFVEEIEKNPEALIIGWRQLTGGGKRLKSRILRAHSNFWVWVLTGKWVRDSQCGYRAYPIDKVHELLLKTKKYDYEIEVLVKSLWTGTPVSEIPIAVEYVKGSKSHFRPFRDFMRVFVLICSLFLQKLFIPAPLLALRCLRSYQEGIRNRRFHEMILDTLAHECPSAGHFALSVGVGVFFGIAPLWGFQMSAALLVAHKLRLSKSISLVSSNISFPAAIPFIIYGSLLVGRWVLSGVIDYSLNFDRTQIEVAAQTYALEYLAGSVLLAAVAGAGAALLAFAAGHLFSLLRRRQS